MLQNKWPLAKCHGKLKFVSKKRVCHIKGSESSESAFLYRYFVYILIKCGADEFN